MTEKRRHERGPPSRGSEKEATSGPAGPPAPSPTHSRGLTQVAAPLTPSSPAPGLSPRPSPENLPQQPTGVLRLLTDSVPGHGTADTGSFQALLRQASQPGGTAGRPGCRGLLRRTPLASGVCLAQSAPRPLTPPGLAYGNLAPSRHRPLRASGLSFCGTTQGPCQMPPPAKTPASPLCSTGLLIPWWDQRHYIFIGALVHPLMASTRNPPPPRGHRPLAHSRLLKA